MALSIGNENTFFSSLISCLGFTYCCPCGCPDEVQFPHRTAQAHSRLGRAGASALFDQQVACLQLRALVGNGDERLTCS